VAPPENGKCSTLDPPPRPHRRGAALWGCGSLSLRLLDKPRIQKFGFSPDAVERHSNRHLLPQQRAAILSAQNPSGIDLEALRVSESEGLLSHVLTQRARLNCAAVSVEAAVTSNLQLSARLLGQLTTVVDHRHSSLLLSPDYIKLRSTLVDVLRALPAAARDVAAALHRLERDAAETIAAPRPSRHHPR
jgi:hypothetical protein